MTNKILNIAEEYSDTPAGRYLSDGNYSGQRFRDEFLFPALQNNCEVEVILDGTLGCGSSFLEEAFGGLIREKNMDLAEIESKLHITSSRALYKNKIWQYLKDAQLEKKKKK
ncbi:MAG: STAS-like domain-containing protein [Methylococcaceae bacterium]|nr:STAS-like domain-containing protein [Methylococcaceae bacterium]